MEGSLKVPAHSLNLPPRAGAFNEPSGEDQKFIS